MSLVLFFWKKNSLNFTDDEFFLKNYYKFMCDAVDIIILARLFRFSCLD